MMKEVKIYTGETTVFSTSGAGKTGQICAKNEIGLLSYMIYKNKLKRVKNLNVRPETKNLLKEIIESKTILHQPE